MYTGPHIVNDNLVFGYDTGYGVADNSTATRFYPGEPTTNLVTTNLETLGTDGSGQSSVGTRTTIAPNHVRIVDVTSNTRQSHFIQGLTASTTYTVSIQFKKVTGTPTFRFQIQGYNNSSYVSTIKFTNTAETGLLDIDGWQTAKWTFMLPSNCNAARIWWQDGADYTTYTHTFELKNPQLEAKGHVTPYVSGTRSSTQSLIDLKRTTNIDVSNVSFDSTGQPTFDGTDDYISKTRNQYGISDLWSVELVFEPTDDSDTAWNGLFGGSLTQGGYWFFHSAGNLAYYEGSSGAIGTKITYRDWNKSNTFTQDNHHHLVITYTPSSTTAGTFNLYYNGGEKTDSFSWTFGWNHSLDSRFIGSGDGRFGTNDVRIYKEYSKALTAAEVKQNYNAYKNRFNI
jgi:hypothetical protein